MPETKQSTLIIELRKTHCPDLHEGRNKKKSARRRFRMKQKPIVPRGTKKTFWAVCTDRERENYAVEWS